MTPAAEWLLDNYHLVDEQIREIRDDLPPGYYRQLPKLADGPLAGYPRVFGVAWAFVAHTDSRFDPDDAAPLRARLPARPAADDRRAVGGRDHAAHRAGREPAARAARRIVMSRAARQEADALADRLLGRGGAAGRAASPRSLRRYDKAPLAGAFAVQLVQRLRDQDPKVTPALRGSTSAWRPQGMTVDAVVHGEHQRQGATNVTVRNIITSMRLISDVDWAELFESVSLVDDVLRAGSGFAQMDFATRNLYRNAIEELARGLEALGARDRASGRCAAAAGLGAEGSDRARGIPATT